MLHPHGIGVAIYYADVYNFMGEEVYVAKGLRDREMQRTSM